MGNPVGIILEAEGKTIYHAGDTALFSDMAMIGERFDIDVAFYRSGIRWAFKMLQQQRRKREQSSTDPLQYVSNDQARSANLL